MFEFETVVTNNGKVLSGPGRTYLPTGAQNPANIAPSGKGKSLFHTPNKKIMKAVGQAVKDWSMIEEGDRLLLGLSGGKDSLALLHILIALQVRTHCTSFAFNWFLPISERKMTNHRTHILLILF